MKKFLLFFILLFSFSGYAQNVGDFQTRPTGVTWPQNWNTSVWQVYTSTGWQNTAAYPGQTPGNYKVTILSGDEVNTAGFTPITIGNLYVNGTLNITEDFTINTFGSGPAPYLFIQDGLINMYKNVNFRLPVGSNIFINITDADTQGIKDVNGCTGNTRIYIGSNVFTACQGTTADPFPVINNTAADASILADASPSTICLGASVNLIGDKQGAAAVTDIQWTLVNRPSGPVSELLGTSATVPYTYTVSPTTLNAAGDYVFQFSFKLGGALKTKTVNVRVNGPTFTTTPAAATTYCLNVVPAPLSVVATGAGTLTYQWYSNTVDSNTSGTVIPGATGSSYIPPTDAVGTTYYYIMVTAACGVATSNTAKVLVNPSSATVTTHPVSATYCQNTSATALTVSGSGVNGYQWYSSTSPTGPGTAISGQTGASYTPPTTTAGTVYYYALLQGSCGAAPSNRAVLTVTANNTASVPSATPTLCINTALPSITHTTTGATGIANNGVFGANGLPAGVRATWAGNVITISGTPTAFGTFNYSILLTGGCGTASATGTITVTPNVAAGTIVGTSPIFIGTTATYTVTGTSGGTWSSGDTSVFTVDSSTGLVTAVGAGSAQITYTVTGCGGTSTATATVVVTDVTTWTGVPATGSWSYGPPAAHIRAVIAGSYTTSAKGNFTAKDLTVNAAGSLVIEDGHAVAVVNGITNNGILTVKNNGNLIQVNNSANTGNVEVQKLFTFSSGRIQYNYVSSPTINTNLKSIYTGSLDNSVVAQYHNENTNRFYSSSGAYIAGRALALKEPATGTSGSTAANPAKFIGVPFNGDLNYPLAYTSNNPTVTHGYNLVGNPYPSNIDVVSLFAANSSLIESTILFWDNRGNNITQQQGSGYTGESYARLNAETGTAIAAATAPGQSGYTERLPSRYVSPAQGFMVRALSTANGAALKFNNTMRVSNPTVQFFGKNNTETMDRYWLGITSPTGIRYSAAVVYYDGGSATVGSDDSKASGSSDNIFTMAEGEQIAIHGRPAFQTDDILGLGYRAFAAGNYTISLQNSEGVFSGDQKIYLKDTQTGVVTDLTAGNYVFASDKGEFTGRFEIVYKPQTVLGTGNSVKTGVQLYRDGEDFVVRSSDQSLGDIEVYDVGGRLILTLKVNSREARFKAERLTDGVYIVRSVMKDGTEFTGKIRK